MIQSVEEGCCVAEVILHGGTAVSCQAQGEPIPDLPGTAGVRTVYNLAGVFWGTLLVFYNHAPAGRALFEPPQRMGVQICSLALVPMSPTDVHPQ